MPVIHAHKDYWGIKQKLTKRNDEFFAQWVEFSSVLVKHWYSQFTIVEFQVLTFIAGRTLLFRKKAEGITRAQFFEGVFSETDGQVCAGCGLGETTLRMALKSLEDKDYIRVHGFSDGKSEQVSRIYEIMPQKLLESFDISEVTNMLRRAGMGRLGADLDDYDNEDSSENDDFFEKKTPLTKRGTPPHQMTHLTDILRISKTSTNVDVSAASQPTISGPVLRTSRSKRKGVAIDCKPQSPIPDKARAKLEAIQGAQKAASAARVKSASKLPTKSWTSRDLQALLDEARSRCGLAIPRVVVTTKPINTLHRRMVAAGVEDAMDFFTWALRNWNMVANANRKAKAKKMREQRASDTEMALSPNFNDLAYRFPYILAFYNDRKCGEMLEEQERKSRVSEKEVVASTQREAIERNKARAARQDRQKELERQKADEEFEARRRARRARHVSDDDDEIPQFRERAWGE